MMMHGHGVQNGAALAHQQNAAAGAPAGGADEVAQRRQHLSQNAYFHVLLCFFCKSNQQQTDEAVSRARGASPGCAWGPLGSAARITRSCHGQERGRAAAVQGRERRP